MSGTATFISKYSFPTPAINDQLNMSVFAIAEDRGVYHKWRAFSTTGDEIWYPNGSLENRVGTVSDIQNGVLPISASPGSLDLFVTGTDNAMYQMHYENGDWSSWQNTNFPNASSAPSGVSNGPNEDWLWYVGPDHQLYNGAGTSVGSTKPWEFGGWDALGGNWSTAQPTSILRGDSYVERGLPSWAQ